MEKIQMEVGKIYFISFGVSTQLVVKYKGEDVCNYLFFDYLHYWNMRQMDRMTQRTNLIEAVAY